MYDERLYQLDLRASKVFVSAEGTRLQANLDLYNAANAGAILSINTTYGFELDAAHERAARPFAAPGRAAGFLLLVAESTWGRL
jgi:hypothetical protein